MSKKRNLFVAVICLVLAFVCLVSCVTLSPEQAAKTQAETDAQEVLGKLVWSEEDRTNVVSSLSFATSNRNYPGVTISWSSSEEDIIANDGKVNRPESDDPRNELIGEDLYATVIVTATVVAEYSWEDNGTHSASTDPISKQFEFKVLAKPEGTDVGTIADVKARAWNYIYVEKGVEKALVSNSNVIYNVLINGVVTAKLQSDGATKGFFMHDGTEGIYVYGDNTKINVGEKVEVIGEIYSYYGNLQVGSNVTVNKVSAGNYDLPDPEVITPEDWENRTSGLGDDVIGRLGGDLLKVEGYLTAKAAPAGSGKYCVVDAFTGEESWIYYKSYTAEMEQYLVENVGKYVQVQGVSYDRDSRITKNELLWTGEIEEVAAPVVDDETKANVLLSQITLSAAYEEDFDLSDAGVWEVVSGTGVEIVEGVAKVTRADEDQEVVLKVTVTVGEVSVSNELTVTIKKIVKETPKHAGTQEDPYTVSDAVLVAGGLADQEKTDTVYAYGTVKEITELSLSYGNASFIITDGNSDLVVYRAKYLNGEKFTSEDQLKVGDVVVIVGQLTNWAGTLEFNSGCNIDSFGKVEEKLPFELNTAYLYVSVQENLNKTLYLTGEMNGYYYASTTDVAAAAKVYVEAVDGGYNLKVVKADASIVYMDIVASGSYVNAVYVEAPTTPFAYNEDYQTFTKVVNDTEYYYGTYNSFDTFGASKLSYADTSFVGHLCDVEGLHEHNFIEGKCECGEEDPNYVKPEPPVSAGLVEGQAYVIGATNGKGTLYFNGTQSSGRFNGVYEKEKATKVYVEVVEGNFKLYFLDGDTKTYIVMADESTGGSFTTDAAAATVFEWNADKNTLAVAEDSNNRAFGVSATSTYDNFSCYDLTGSYNWGQFLPADGETPEPPVHEHKFVEGKCECGEEDPNYVKPEPPVSAGLVEGQAYVIGATNGKGTLYFNGTQSSGRFNGVYEKEKATKVYVEVVEGNFKLYFLDGDTKTYIVMADESTGGSFTTDAAAATVFEWNADKNTLAVAEDSNNRAFGVSATSTYDNFSCYDLTGSYNWGQFEAVA